MKLSPRQFVTPPATLKEFALTSALYEAAWLSTYYGLNQLLAPPQFAGHNLGPTQSYTQFRSRIYSGAGLVLRSAAIPTAYVATPIVLFELNKAVIEASPEEEQRGGWMMLSSALTGTFGGDYSTLI